MHSSTVELGIYTNWTTYFGQIFYIMDVKYEGYINVSKLCKMYLEFEFYIPDDGHV
jgi:hypothetical protein